MSYPSAQYHFSLRVVLPGLLDGSSTRASGGSAGACVQDGVLPYQQVCAPGHITSHHMFYHTLR